MCSHDNTILKTCTKCGEAKPATAVHFSRDRRLAHGLSSWCKACKAERAREYYADNREQALESQRQWRADNLDRDRQRKRKWYAENREQEIERVRKWKVENREQALEHSRKWKVENPEKRRAMRRRRRARKAKAEGDHTPEDIRAQYKAQKGRCYYAACGYSKLGDDYHIDHIVPLSRGGTNDIDNLVIACPSCNLAKSDRLPSEWAEGGRLL